MRLVALLLFCVSVCSAQLNVSLPGPGPIHIASSQFPGWAWNMDAYSGSNLTNTGACVAGTSCTLPLLTATTSSSTTAWAIGVLTTNNVTISRVCTNDAICASSNDNWTTTATNHVNGAGGNLDMAYNVNGTHNSSSFTMILSGASGANFLVVFFEFQPPPGFTPAFDSGATASSGSCTTCTLAAPTVSGTDAVVHFQVSSGSVAASFNQASSPYLQDFVSPSFGLNITSGTAPTFTQTSGNMVDTAMSFKTTSPFTANASNSLFTMKNIVVGGFTGTICSNTTGCTLSVTPSAGDLLFLAIDDSSGIFLGSVTDNQGNSWVIPSAANTCKGATPGNANHLLHCAYVLSAAAGATTVTIKAASGSPALGLQLHDVSRSSGSFSLDFMGSAQTASGGGLVVTGVAPTGITGPDACFESMFTTGGSNEVTLYPLSSNNLNGGNGPNPEQNYSIAALLNTGNNTAPLIGTTSSSEGFFAYTVCFK